VRLEEAIAFLSQSGEPNGLHHLIRSGLGDAQPSTGTGEEKSGGKSSRFLRTGNEIWIPRAAVWAVSAGQVVEPALPTTIGDGEVDVGGILIHVGKRLRKDRTRLY
jgi:hypothetical protein